MNIDKEKSIWSRIFTGDRLFWLLATVLLILGLGRGALWASEDRWAEIAREMLLTGDYFHPAINGEVYFDKPLFTYWLIVLAAKIFNSCNEFVVRLPGALLGLAALGGVRFLGRKFWTPEIGRLAGWILLSSYGFIFWARTASAEVANMAAVLFAVCWFFSRKDKAGFFSYLLFYLICFVGALCKGLPALVLPPVLVGAYVLLDKSWKQHLKISNFAAFFIGLGVFLLPFLIAAKLPLPANFSSPDSGLTGLELVWRENVIRVFQPFDHDDEPFFIYFFHVPRIMLPWSVLLLAALYGVIARWKQLSLNNRWLLIASAIIFVMFSASGSRRWYYILPIMPFLALLMAEYLAGNLAYPLRRANLLFHQYLILTAGIVGTLALLAAPFVLRIDKISAKLTGLPPDIIWAMPIIGLLLLLLALYRGDAFDRKLKLPASWGTIALSMALFSGGVFAIIYSGGREVNTEKMFALHLKQELAGVSSQDLAFYLKSLPKIVYYMEAQPPIPVLDGPEEMRRHLAAATRPVYVFIEGRRRFLDELKTAFPEIDFEHPAYLEGSLAIEKNGRKIHCVKVEPGQVKPIAN